MSYADIKETTAESIKFADDLAVFLKERQALEVHYINSLANICNKFIKGKRIEDYKHTSQEELNRKSKLLKSTLWSTAVEQVQDTLTYAQTQGQMLVQMERVIVKPLHDGVKEMEAVWKSVSFPLDFSVLSM